MNNADKFKSAFGLYATEVWAMSEKEFIEWLKKEDDVPDRKVGKWIAVKYNDGTVRTECSVCGYGRGLPPVRHYCPNCGARMEAEE